MPELTAATIVGVFYELADRDPGVSLVDRLREIGWTELPPDRGRPMWQRGEIVADYFPHGVQAPFLEVTTEIVDPDLDTPDIEQQLYVDFESRFRRNLAECVQVVGEPTLVGRYGDQGIPTDPETAMTAYWRTGSGMVALNFTHEDSGLPFRITVTVR